MIIIDSPDIIKQNKTCVALGNFDGVHIGHRKIIFEASKYAATSGLLSCIYTFSKHPSEYLGGGKLYLTDFNEKKSIFESLPADLLYIEDFDRVRNTSPLDFCKIILKDKLNASCVFCGENYTFGHMGNGNTKMLATILDELGIRLVIVPYVLTDDNSIVSSTMIRRLISEGKVYEASKLMMSFYTIKGQVMHGKQLGRKLGFPTLNISVPPQKTVPKFGVYISMCLLDGTWYKGITNIGIRPTTDTGTSSASKVNCETFLFDYSGDAYNKWITVSLFDMIRPEIHFNNIEELKSQISKDKQIAEEWFNKEQSIQLHQMLQPGK